MNIKQIKEKMLKWKDYAGFDLVSVDEIKKAKTKDELRQILLNHQYWVEMSYHVDHMKSVDIFRGELGM